jgi:hypothetical protein
MTPEVMHAVAFSLPVRFGRPAGTPPQWKVVCVCGQEFRHQARTYPLAKSHCLAQLATHQRKNRDRTSLESSEAEARFPLDSGI